MKIEYKQFDFAETLKKIDNSLYPDTEKLIPNNHFLPITEDSGNECAFAGVIAAYVRLSVYDNSDLDSINRSYDIVKHVIYDIFRDNCDCIDMICMGRFYCGIFNTPSKSNINDLIVTMSKLNSSISVLDIKLYKRFKISVKVNLGCDYGELFRLKDNFNKVNNKIPSFSWNGGALNLAIIYANSNLIDGRNCVIISENIKQNIKLDYAKFFQAISDSAMGGYSASLVDSKIFEWVKNNR